MTIAATTAGVDRLRSRLRSIGTIARKPYDAGRGQLAIRRVRAVSRTEMDAGAGFGPSGAATPMAPTKPFGTKPATTPPLGGAAGSLGSAIQGGPGGSTSTGPNRAAIKISLPHVTIHREGGTIAITPRMRRFVGAVYGTGFPKGQTVITMPARTFLDMAAPQYQKAVKSVMVEAIEVAA